MRVWRHFSREVTRSLSTAPRETGTIYQHLPGEGMTSMVNVLDAVTVNVRTLPEGTDLLSLLRDAATTSEADWGTSWILATTDASTPQLMVGVRGDVGALVWYQPAEIVPAHGLNADPVDYSLADQHHTPIPPGGELPVDRVFAAVDEFVRTGQRPTCVEWAAEV